MPISASDLLFKLSANMPQDDTTTSGGAIDSATKLTDFILAATDTLEILSSDSGDTTQTVTVTGRNAAGAIITDTKTLSGTTPVAITGSFERVSLVTKSATTTGTVTLRRTGAGATVATLEPTITKTQRMFYDSASEASPVLRYEKSFALNNHGTLTLSAAKVSLNADPSANYRIGLTAAINDTTSVTNRKTAPGGVTFSDDGVLLNVPGGVLAAGDRIGVWAEQDLGASEAAHKSTFTLKLEGTTT